MKILLRVIISERIFLTIVNIWSRKSRTSLFISWSSLDRLRTALAVCYENTNNMCANTFNNTIVIRVYFYLRFVWLTLRRIGIAIRLHMFVNLASNKLKRNKNDIVISNEDKYFPFKKYIYSYKEPGARKLTTIPLTPHKHRRFRSKNRINLCKKTDA